MSDRLITWPSLYPESFQQLDAKQQRIISQQIETFNQQLKQPLPAVAVKREYDQHLIRLKIDEMYRYRDDAELKIYLQRLETAACPQLVGIKLFAKACYADLMDQHDLAVSNYFAAANAGFAEVSLNHLTSKLLQKRDYQNALFALEALCQVNPIYYSQLARLYEACHEDRKAC